MSAVFHTQYLLVFCILTSVLATLTSNQSLDITELVKVRRQDKNDGRNQWRINNPWEGARPRPLLNPEKGLLPFLKSGDCKRGWTYKITKGDDLLNFENELECVFFSGITPSKIPLGPLNGTVLSIFDTKQFLDIINLVWFGKVVNEVECLSRSRVPQLRSVFIGWNNLLSHLVVPFVARLGTINENLAPGEYYDGKSNLIIDYTQDFSSLCLNFEDLKRSQGMDIPTRNVYPLNQMVDALRLVGRQSDGGSIYLGKTYLRFRQTNTVIYFYFLNYDMDVNPEFQPGEKLPPLIRSFSYSIRGI